MFHSHLWGSVNSSQSPSCSHCTLLVRNEFNEDSATLWVMRQMSVYFSRALLFWMRAINVAGDSFVSNIHFCPTESNIYYISLTHDYKWLPKPYLSYPFTANYPQVFSLVCLSSLSNTAPCSLHFNTVLNILAFLFSSVFAAWVLQLDIRASLFEASRSYMKPTFILFQVYAHMWTKTWTHAK